MPGQQALMHNMCAQVTDTALIVGAAVTLSRLQARLGELVAAGAPHETGVFAALLEQLRYFAGVQIRNVATVGGCATDPGTCCAVTRRLCFCTAHFSLLLRAFIYMRSWTVLHCWEFWVVGSCVRVSRLEPGRMMLSRPTRAYCDRNIVTGSPISDINPLYMAAGATFTVAADGSPTHEVTSCASSVSTVVLWRLLSAAFVKGLLQKSLRTLVQGRLPFLCEAFLNSITCNMLVIRPVTAGGSNGLLSGLPARRATAA